MVSIASSLGVGSGIDTAKLISDLAKASRAPKEEALAERLSNNKARISAVAQVRSDIESFASSFADLVEGGTLRSQPAISDPSVISAASQGGIRAGMLSAQIEVLQLASAQSVYSDYIGDVASPVGQGTMNLSVGGINHAIVINASNDSLTGLAAAINAAASGVTATLMSDSNGSRLVLKGTTGAASAFSLSTVSGDPVLGNFAYPASSNGLTLAQSAQDASYKIDGIAFSSATNTITEALPGITVTLKNAAPGKMVSLTGTRPTDTLKETLQDFISVFNTLKSDIAKAQTATSGDHGLRQMQQKLSSLVSAAVTTDPTIQSLSDIGVRTNRDGSISLDSNQLEAALRDHPDAVEALFTPTRDATHSATSDPGLSGALNQLKDVYTASRGPLDSLKIRLEKEANAIEKATERMELREEAYAARLAKQFGGMDARVAALKATQSYLEQQVAIWTQGS